MLGSAHENILLYDKTKLIKTKGVCKKKNYPDLTCDSLGGLEIIVRTWFMKVKEIKTSLKRR